MAGSEMNSIDSSFLLKSNAPRLFAALALAKWKPAGLSIKDFILQLREHVREGRREHIDSVSFWRDALAASEVSQITLRQQVTDLETQNAELRAQLELSKKGPSKIGGSPTCHKRDRSYIETEEQNGCRDTVKRRQDHRTEDSAVHMTLDEMEVFLKNDPAKSCLRQCYTLRQLTSHAKPSPKDIAILISSMSSTALKMLRDIPIGHCARRPHRVKSYTHKGKAKMILTIPTKHPKKDECLRFLDLLRWTFVELLHGMDTLELDREGKIFQPQVTYSITTIIRTILERITAHSAVEAPLRPSANAKIPKPTTTQTRSKASSRADLPTQSTNSEEDTRIGLCRLYVTVLASLNVSNPQHQEIAQASLFYLVKRVGEVLKLFVFDTDNSPRADGDPDATATNQSLHLHSTETAEAPYLIWILERALYLQQQHHHQPSSSPPYPYQPPSSQPHPSQSPFPTFFNRHNLATHLQRQMQTSLLKAVFNYDKTSFQNGLAEPVAVDPAGLLGLEPHVEMGVPMEDRRNWFKQEVWRLVGWDLLKEKIGEGGKRGA